MANNQINGVPVNGGGTAVPTSEVKESFKSRFTASFESDAKLRRWAFVFASANCTLLVLAAGFWVMAFHLRDYWSQYNPFFTKYTVLVYSVIRTCMVVVILITLISWIIFLYFQLNSFCHYGSTIFVLTVLQLAFLLLFLGKSEFFLNSISEQFENGLQHYLDDNRIRDAVNYVQQNLLCCGAEDMSDWFDTATNALPHSCCSRRPSGGEHNCLVIDMLYVQTDSCLPKLKVIPSNGITYIYAFTACIIIIEMVVILLTTRVLWLFERSNINSTIPT